MADTQAARPLTRILLKISGEALLGAADYGIDPAILKRIAGEIRDVMARNVQVAVVVGGGNIFRGAGLARDDHDPGQRERDAEPLEDARPLPARETVDDRDRRPGRRDRRDDAHRPECEALVERRQADRAAEAGEQAERERALVDRVARDRDGDEQRHEPRRLRDHRDRDRREPPREQPAREVRHAPGRRRREREDDGQATHRGSFARGAPRSGEGPHGFPRALPPVRFADGTLRARR